MIDRFPYMLSRIIGNELPNRDNIGGRIKAYKFILENEPEFDGVFKRWIINRVYSQEYLAAIISLLLEYEANFIINPFVGADYIRQRTYNDRVRYAINANVGRNFALRDRNMADLNLIFDGECMLTDEAFDSIVHDILNDARTNAGILKQYYSVPMKRISIHNFHFMKHDKIEPEEPQLIFKDDSTLLFDESMVYPTHDKCELLWRLGHSREHRKQHVLVSNKQCTSVGYVLHINTGIDAIEEQLPERDRARSSGILSLLAMIDKEFNCVQ